MPEFQDDGFIYTNPLQSRFSREFFRNIPKLPGVYWMLGEDGRILYIGKAKNLRNRLNSYCYINSKQSSKKLLQLVRLVSKIEWEICKSEETALIREDELLKVHRPPFNLVNISSVVHYFIKLKIKSNLLQFRLATNSYCLADEEIFGAFKATASVRRGFIALLRLLWIVLAEKVEFNSGDSYKYPWVLEKRKNPNSYTILLDSKIKEGEKDLWLGLIKKFLKGDSDVLLQKLTEELLEIINIPSFMYSKIQEDLVKLAQFFYFGPNLNWYLKASFGLKLDFLPENELSSLIIRERIQRARKVKKDISE